MDKTQDLAGGYVLLTTYARLTPAEKDLTKDWDETPLEMFAVSKDYLERWVLCSDFHSLADLLSYYAYDRLTGLADSAERAGAMAFSYRPGLDRSIVLPELCKGTSLLAFADFLSGQLQAEGYAAASKYIDAFLEL